MSTTSTPSHRHEPARVRNFSLAFQQMCNFVAIADTKSVDETLQRLILQCLVVLPDERFTDAAQITQVLDTLFGLRVAEHEVQYAVDRLLASNQLRQPANTNFTLPPRIREQLDSGIKEALSLERRVKEGWFEELSTRHPQLPLDDAWKGLQDYLAKTFRRHGIQTTALLDPSVETPTEFSRSLASMLDDTIKATFSQPLRAVSRQEITSFLATTGANVDRSAYIAQLADGAFSYFALTVSPDVSEQFRARLNPLILLLDTNFLFGILGLHQYQFTYISEEMVGAIKQYGFPFKLRYHEVTKRELLSTLNYYGDRLRERRWSRQLSRSVLSSSHTASYLSGIERMYHQRNAATGLDVESFLAPFQHIDVTLKERGIDVYNPRGARLEERNTIYHEYEAFLKARSIEKPYESMMHDATILDSARQQRSRAKSSLDAGALLITGDTYLYRFDWETCRKHGIQPCAVLPSLFWQLLRPFVPSNPDFDRSFAATFAVPEFRTVASGAAADAYHKLLSILAGYEGLREETAAKMLSNDLLLVNLSKEKNEHRFKERVESALAAANSELLEENAALSAQMELERAGAEERAKRHEQEQVESRKAQEDARLQIAQAGEAAQAAVQEAARLERERQDAIDRAREADAARQKAQREKDEADRRAAEAEQRAKQVEEERRQTGAAVKAVAFSAFITGLVMAVLLGLLYGTKWDVLDWLRVHTSGYGILLCFAFAVFSGMLAITRKEWRGPAILGGVAGAYLVIAQISGGPLVPR